MQRYLLSSPWPRSASAVQAIAACQARLTLAAISADFSCVLTAGQGFSEKCWSGWVRQSLVLLSLSVTECWTYDLNCNVIISDSLWGMGEEKEASCPGFLLLRIHKSRLCLPGISFATGKGCAEEQKEAAHQPSLYKQYLLQWAAEDGCTTCNQRDLVSASFLSICSPCPWRCDLLSTSQGRKADRVNQEGYAQSC